MTHPKRRGQSANAASIIERSYQTSSDGNQRQIALLKSELVGMREEMNRKGRAADRVRFGFRSGLANGLSSGLASGAIGLGMSPPLSVVVRLLTTVLPAATAITAGLFCVIC